MVKLQRKRWDNHLVYITPNRIVMIYPANGTYNLKELGGELRHRTGSLTELMTVATQMCCQDGDEWEDL
jgi:hypothetical protein